MLRNLPNWPTVHPTTPCFQCFSICFQVAFGPIQFINSLFSLPSGRPRWLHPRVASQTSLCQKDLEPIATTSTGAGPHPLLFLEVKKSIDFPGSKKGEQHGTTKTENWQQDSHSDGCMMNDRYARDSKCKSFSGIFKKPSTKRKQQSLQSSDKQ